MPSTRPFLRGHPARVAPLAGVHGRHAHFGAAVTPTGAYFPQRHHHNPYGSVSARTAAMAGMATSYGKTPGKTPTGKESSGTWSVDDPKATDTANNSGGGGVNWNQVGDAIGTGINVVQQTGVLDNLFTSSPFGPQSPGQGSGSSGHYPPPPAPKPPEKKGVPGWLIGVGIGTLVLGAGAIFVTSR